MPSKTLLAGLAGAGMMTLTSTVAALPTYEVTPISNYWWGRAMNDNAKIVGNSPDAGGRTYLFKWEPNTDYGDRQVGDLERAFPFSEYPSRNYAAATAVNNNGAAAGMNYAGGYSPEEENTSRLVVWNPDGETRGSIEVYGHNLYRDLHLTEAGQVYFQGSEDGTTQYLRYEPGPGLQEVTRAAYEEATAEEMTPKEERTWEIVEEYGLQGHSPDSADIQDFIDPSDPHYTEEGENPRIVGTVTDVNASGQILLHGPSDLVEFGTFPGANGTQLLTPNWPEGAFEDGEPIPAPHTAALLGLGLVGLAGWRGGRVAAEGKYGVAGRPDAPLGRFRLPRRGRWARWQLG
ncbi:hypothetical protein [Thiohalorhabdus methylotrophus]|uniref:PEP-CTERM protein-sorting domain-containing protein n=1 Tax=Thiohalorhabdus methylotrophus TaxID=3242694 RepID=A0ABV4TTS9_9GAMM